MHHIICDNESMQIFRRELIRLYGAFSQNKPSPLPDLPVQFGDFAAWERRSLTSEFMKQQLDYWRTRLTASVLEPTARPAQPKEPNFRTARQRVEIEDDLFSLMKAAARQANCTVYVVLLGAIALLVYSQTGKKDVRIGALLANRRLSETEDLMGHLVNTAVLRIPFCPPMTFKQVIEAVKKVLLAALSRAEIPFAYVARALEEQEKIPRSSLFQVLVGYQRSSALPVNANGLTIASLDLTEDGAEINVRPTMCDLSFSFRETETALTGTLTYKTDVPAVTIAGMTTGLSCVLRELLVEMHRSRVTPRQHSGAF
jgi:hypothetical protein